MVHALVEKGVVATDHGVAGLAVGFESGTSVFFDLILIPVSESPAVEPDQDGSGSVGFQRGPEIEDVALMFRVILNVAFGISGKGSAGGGNKNEKDSSVVAHDDDH